VSVGVQQGWKEFLEQRAFVVRDANGADRAFSPARADDASGTRCVDLNHWSALRLVGPDAVKFLQGYLTCDMTTLEPARALSGAYCNIKGRVIADATVVRTDGHPTLVIHASLRETVVESLRKYLAFSRSRFAAADTAPILLGIVAPRDASLPTEPLTVVPFRGGHAVAMPGVQRRVLLLLPAAAAQSTWLEFAARGETGDANVWDLHDVRAGIAHVCAATSETFLPQMLDYDQLGAVSFTKGCYLGQEIVARTQHRGRPKRHLHRMTWSGAPQPSVGASLVGSDGNRAGTLVNVAATSASAGEALAVLNDVAIGPLQGGTVKFALQ
jgi:folate-binding protein YgfZ